MQFRIAMILKFVSFLKPGDFYYKDLPAFYPPLYYFLLSVYARLFSIEAYKMLKIGSMLIYAFGPFLLYYFWRRLVSPFQGLLITLSTFMICSFSGSSIQSVPHAFLANSFFIPWWLFFVELTGKSRKSWRFYLEGGIIGAVIFSTYFYPFFLGAFLLALRAVVPRSWRFIKGSGAFSWKGATKMFASVALLSAPYWLPLLLSVAEHGTDRSRGGWHHLGSTGLVFQFMEFSLPGILFLGSIVYALNRRASHLHRGLLLLLGSSVLYLLPGSLLGAFNLSVNLIKAREFVVVLGAALIGLAAAGVLRWSRRHAKARVVVPVLLSIGLLISLHNINQLGKDRFVRVARSATVPSWNLDSEEMAARSGSVFLTGFPELCSFYPVYTFISTNEHYSHPASRFARRLDLLNLLRFAPDPDLFRTGLRHNRYDAVDYFMPRRHDGVFEVYVNVSNYPNGLSPKVLSFDERLFADSAFFRKEKGNDLYRLRSHVESSTYRQFSFEGMSATDSLGLLRWAQKLASHLDSTGLNKLAFYLGQNGSAWPPLSASQELHRFADLIILTSVEVTPANDSLVFMLEFETNEDITADYKIFFHAYDQKDRSRFANYDFWPGQRTNSWRRGEVFCCRRTVPDSDSDMIYHVGFYQGKARLGNGYWGKYDRISPQDESGTATEQDSSP